ncbi:MAG: PQQ-dependent sugar dehydrogenase [Actinomycetota bacterium]
MTQRRTSLAVLAPILLGALLVLPPPPARAATGLIPFKEELEFPAAFTFAPDGRVFYAERLTGEVRILAADASTDDLFVTVPGLWFDQGGGVLGLALHPAYPTTPQVYVYATRDIGGAPRNQILRYTDTAGTGTGLEVIWDGGIDAGHRHRGGRILFGADGMLYALQGDTSVPGHAQRLTNTAGKVLRMTPDGAVPGDNPFPGNLIYAYGLRKLLRVRLRSGERRALGERERTGVQ